MSAASGENCQALWRNIREARLGTEMLNIYVDESGVDGRNRFLVHGALFVRHPALAPMETDVARRLAEHHISDELKWTTLSRGRFARDIKAVATFFEIYETDGVQSAPRFQCLVVDKHHLDTRHFHKGDADLCFYKLLYQLLVKRIQEMAGAGERVHVVLDQRCTRRYDLRDLRVVLNLGLQKSLGWHAPKVASVRYGDSKNEPLIQVADFLTGAVCFRRNGHHLKPGRSDAKWFASEWIARKAGLPTLAKEQYRSAKFGIWTIRLQKKSPHRLAA